MAWSHSPWRGHTPHSVVTFPTAWSHPPQRSHHESLTKLVTLHKKVPYPAGKGTFIIEKLLLVRSEGRY